ncbi:MerR family DNA-binding transcriptional regulator [Lutibacter holmesii]|uniref:MerR family DNA-binding transcriptional regulator n=1 Tax=Lutibacter holmesii TaxID=1137985 RepID=A0ABW3WJ17_9FLAO
MRKEVSKILKVSIVTLHNWDKLGVIQPYRIGKK